MRDGTLSAPLPADSALRQKQVQPAPVQERRELPSLSAPTTAETPAPQAPDAQSPAAQGAGAAAPEATMSVTGARAAARQDATERMRVEEIAKLYAAGRLDAAAAALRELRSTDPHADEQLPEELQSWAATVQD
jgi:hypothetical protein